jgi:hypothetical protein
MAGYMGDKENMIVHHLAMMSLDCRIYAIEKENMLYFIPDTFEQANIEGYLNYIYCIERS